jgi:phosphopentomutase
MSAACQDQCSTSALELGDISQSTEQVSRRSRYRKRLMQVSAVGSSGSEAKRIIGDRATPEGFPRYPRTKGRSQYAGERVFLDRLLPRAVV